MNLTMRSEYFPDESLLSAMSWNISSMPPALYSQSRDWTCSLACLRSIASGIADLGVEDDLIAAFHLEPGPYYSEDVKRLGILDQHDVDVVYGCDFALSAKDVSSLWTYMSQGWRVMTNWMMSYDHWTVMLGYIKSRHGPDYDMWLYYDPYCDEVSMIRNAHFSSMWSSPGGIARDFIAVRAKTV